MSIFERFVGLAIAFGCTLVVSSIGAWLTDIGPWYLSLKQPEWKPPDAAEYFLELVVLQPTSA